MRPWRPPIEQPLKYGRSGAVRPDPLVSRPFHPRAACPGVRVGARDRPRLAADQLAHRDRDHESALECARIRHGKEAAVVHVRRCGPNQGGAEHAENPDRQLVSGNPSGNEGFIAQVAADTSTEGGATYLPIRSRSKKPGIAADGRARGRGPSRRPPIPSRRAVSGMREMRSWRRGFNSAANRSFLARKCSRLGAE